MRAWLRVVRLLVQKEFLQIVRDRATLAQLLLIPFMQLLVLGNAATFTITRTHVVVVDHDRSALSRALVDRLGAGGQFAVVEVTASPAVAEQALRTRRATMVVEVPRRLEARMRREGAAPVLRAVNAEEGAVAGLVSGYAQRIVAELAQEVAADAGRGLGAGARAPGGTLAVRARRWYNPTRDYHHYMVPGIIVSLITIIATLVTAQNVAREREMGTLEQLHVTPLTRAQFMAGKLLPGWLLGMALFVGAMALGRAVFGIPVRGNPLIVVAGAAVYLVVALGIGLLVSTVTRTQQQTMFVSFFILTLYLLMSGLFTPLESMPGWAQGVAAATPVRHFVWVMRAVLVRGAGVAEVWTTIAGLGVAGATVLSLAVWRHHKGAG
jgi:ABC-2 type transport system permease protein